MERCQGIGKCIFSTRIGTRLGLVCSARCSRECDLNCLIGYLRGYLVDEWMELIRPGSQLISE